MSAVGAQRPVSLRGEGPSGGGCRARREGAGRGPAGGGGPPAGQPGSPAGPVERPSQWGAEAGRRAAVIGWRGLLRRARPPLHVCAGVRAGARAAGGCRGAAAGRAEGRGSRCPLLPPSEPRRPAELCLGPGAPGSRGAAPSPRPLPSPGGAACVSLGCEGWLGVWGAPSSGEVFAAARGRGVGLRAAA